MKHPNIFNATSLIHDPRWRQIEAGLPDGRVVPARPLGFASIGNRFRCAWKVFKGEWDALKWDGQ